MNKTKLLPTDIQEVLDTFQTSLIGLESWNHHAIYRALQEAASRFAPLDAFYVGFYRENNIMIYPYSFDDGKYDFPEAAVYSDKGLSAWMLREKKAYLFKDDDGELLNRGKTFGQDDKLSADAIVVPILKRQGKRASRVIGVMSMQTYTPRAYNRTTARAFEALAESLVKVFEREDLAQAYTDSSVGEAQTVTDPSINPQHIVNQLLANILQIEQKGKCVKAMLEENRPYSEIVAMVESLIEASHHAQTGTMELFLPRTLTKNSALANLTDLHKAIVRFLVQGAAVQRKGYSNSELAVLLNIGEQTVRGELKKIYAEVGVSDRKELIDYAKKFIPDVLA